MTVSRQGVTGPIGILGAGQLGRMLALAGYPLGLRFRFLDPAPDAAAGRLGEHFAAPYTDQAALLRFASGLDRVTFEFENVPVAAAEALAQLLPVYPPASALGLAQDRLSEKSLFQALDIPTTAFIPVESQADLQAALELLGLPAVLKTRRLGYDGKGQVVLRLPADASAAWQALGSQPLILERYLPFDRELSILAVRGQDGASVFYPLVQNFHRDGILRLSLAPAPALAPDLQRRAEDYACRVLERLEYVGVLAIELFEFQGGLLANEMAPRVHNSGHWSIEGAATSQFENHLRAVCGLPLGETRMYGTAAMLNLIGELPDLPAVLAIPGAHLHLYDKEPRPGRKIGHITVCAGSPDELWAILDQLNAVLSLPELDSVLLRED